MMPSSLLKTIKYFNCKNTYMNSKPSLVSYPIECKLNGDY